MREIAHLAKLSFIIIFCFWQIFVDFDTIYYFGSLLHYTRGYVG
jgi:hypothetical protein